MGSGAVLVHGSLEAVFIVPVVKPPTAVVARSIVSDIKVARPVSGCRIHVVDHIVCEINDLNEREHFPIFERI